MKITTKFNHLHWVDFSNLIRPGVRSKQGFVGKEVHKIFAENMDLLRAPYPMFGMIINSVHKDVDCEIIGQETINEHDCIWLEFYIKLKNYPIEILFDYKFFPDMNSRELVYERHWLQNGKEIKKENNRECNIGLIDNFVLYTMYALMVMNLKNIVLVDEPRAYEKRRWNSLNRGKKEIIYKLIMVQTARNVYKRIEDTFGPGESNRALGSVRKHIRIYGPDKPMCGKFVGKVWIPAHNRGNRKNGEVIKDYQLVN